MRRTTYEIALFVCFDWLITLPRLTAFDRFSFVCLRLLLTLTQLLDDYAPNMSHLDLISPL